MKSQVSISKTKSNPGYEEIRAAVGQAIHLLGGMRDIVRPGQKVLVNPSWVTAVTKRKEAVIALAEAPPAVADIVKEVGGNPITAESSAIRIDSELVREDERLKIEGVNLIYGNTTCSGCRMGIMSSIFDMKVANQLRKQGNDFPYSLFHDLVRKRANFSMPSSNMERSAA